MIKLLNKIIDLFTMLAMIFVLMLGGYVIYDSHAVTMSANIGDEIRQFTSSDKIDFEGLKGINQRIVG